MRPRGEIRCIVAAALAEQGGTARELAGRTLLSVGHVRTTLCNMMRPPLVQAVVTHTVRRPGVNRPIPVYCTPEARHTGPGLSLEQVWGIAPARTIAKRTSL